MGSRVKVGVFTIRVGGVGLGFVRLPPPHGRADHPSVPLVSFRFFPDARRLVIAHEVIHHQDVHLLFFSGKRKQPWQDATTTRYVKTKAQAKSRSSQRQDKTITRQQRNATQRKTTQHKTRPDKTTQDKATQYNTGNTQDGTR